MKLDEVGEILSTVHEFNRGKTEKFSVILWGPPGIGKTQYLMSWAKENDLESTIVPVAQFAETGDMMGNPVVDPETKRTIYYPPEWWPEEDYDGIVILDDFNRSNNLILQANLHLLQFYEVGRNKLGPNVTLVGTANPSDDDYIVSEVDDALLSRALQYDIKFDPVVWAEWAIKEGINRDFIDYILHSSEEAVTKRNNIRAWTMGFKLGQSFENPNLRQIMTGAVGNVAASAFMQWKQNSQWIKQMDITQIWRGNQLREKLLNTVLKAQRAQQLFFVRHLSTLDIKELSENRKKQLSDFVSAMITRKFPREFMALLARHWYKKDPLMVISNEDLFGITTITP